MLTAVISPSPVVCEPEPSSTKNPSPEVSVIVNVLEAVEVTLLVLL